MSLRLSDPAVEARVPECPKVARLAKLVRAGLPVPRGWVIDDAQLSPTDEVAIEELLAHGAVIVRSAHPQEDSESTSMAGLGRTIAGCGSLSDVHSAIAEIRADAEGANPGAGHEVQILCQREVTRRWLVVAVRDSEQDWAIEAHSAQGPVLATGATPDFAGPLGGWEAFDTSDLRELCDDAAQCVRGEHGVDLEIVIDPENRAWLVQARPLTTKMHPGWPAFEAELQRVDGPGGQDAVPQGSLTLDAEHNPAPLSPAHEWLIGWLGRHRPNAVNPVVLAGWLYVKTFPRDLVGRPPSPHAGEQPGDRQAAGAIHGALERLQRVHLPNARAALESVTRQATDSPPASAPQLVESALAAFGRMIDLYLGELVPARKLAHSHARIADTEHPLSLRDRDAFADVLPTAWDVASPALAELLPKAPQPSTTRAKTARAPLPTDISEAATLLAEWDDHLFALGIAPLRAVYLSLAPALARSLGEDTRPCAAAFPASDVFLLSPPELCEATRHDAAQDEERWSELLASRRQQQQRRSALSPPLRLWDGRPLPASTAGRFRGIPIGPSYEGPIVQYADLESLVRRPPTSDQIVSIPALTAPAALVLHRLGLRAVCTEHGGALSHGALMARELGLSALIGCRGCSSIEDGRRVLIDTRLGRLSPSPATSRAT